MKLVIKLYSWTDLRNFGDAMSKDIVSWVSDEDVELVDARVSGKLVAVGSVLQRVMPGDVVWGTGVHPAGYQHFWMNPDKAKLDITVLATRGPITRDVLIARNVNCPPVFGDPAILLPLFYPKEKTKDLDTVLIPHFADFGYFSGRPDRCLGATLVDPSWDWKEIVDIISKARRVVSSSLHGLIVAEAYGVPAVWYRLSKQEGYIKYQDYYGSTNRAAIPIYDLNIAMKLDCSIPPDYTHMRKELLMAFDKTLVINKCVSS
jgi:pyruvyltransferase